MRSFHSEGQDGIKNSWLPPIDLTTKELASYRSGWIDQMPLRIKEALGFQTFIFLINSGWRTAGMMLIGMALYKLGILLAKKSTSFYLLNLAIGLFVGISLISIGLVENFASDWGVH